MRPLSRTTLAAAVLSIAALSANDARADTPVGFTSFTYATGICQSALPVFDGLIRKRPLSVQNEGSTPAFVTCSWTAQGFIEYIILNARSIDGTSHFVTCTLVTGSDANPRYNTKTYFLAANGTATAMQWAGSEFSAGDNPVIDILASASCRLPTGVALTSSWLGWTNYF